MSRSRPLRVVLIALAVIAVSNSLLFSQTVTRYRDRVEILIDSESNPTDDVVTLQSNGLGTVTLNINGATWLFSGSVPVYDFVDFGGNNTILIEGSYGSSSFEGELGGTNRLTLDHVATTGDFDLSDRSNGHRNVMELIDCSFDDFSVVCANTFCEISVEDSDFWLLKVWTNRGIDLLDVVNTDASYIEFDALQYLTARFRQTNCYRIDNNTTPAFSDVLFEDSFAAITTTHGAEVSYARLNNHITNLFVYDHADWVLSAVLTDLEIRDSTIDHSNITTGRANDRITVTNTSFDGDVTLETKGGQDEITFVNVQTDELMISTGGGADTVRLTEHKAYGLAEITANVNNNVINVSRSEFRDSLNIKSGYGVDHIFIANGTTIRRDLLIDSSRGDDLLVVTDTEVGFDTFVTTGDGFDELIWSYNTTVGSFQAEMGRDDDNLILEESTFKDSITVYGDEGSRDTGNEQMNSIVGPITKAGFEFGNLN